MILRLVLIIVLLALAVVLNLCIGSANISVQQALSALFHAAATPQTASDIIWQIRLPRLLCAFATGCSLAVSGYLLQALSRNYLADPFLTGVSSGAAVVVALSVFFAVPFPALPVAALCGGLIVSLVVAVMARTPSGLSITRLLLAGIAVSAVCSSLITLLLTNSSNAGHVQSLLYWLAGSINGRGWDELTAAAGYICAGLVAALILSKPLRLLSVGSQSAAALGADVARSQWFILFTAVILCGAAVSLSGIVAFVGLVAPYLARTLFGRDERLHIVCAALLGGILVLFSDLAARTLGGGQELPLGTLLSLIGAPFFLFLVMKHTDEV